MKKNCLILSALIVLLICSANLYSQDWPQWCGVNRDSRVTGFKAPATWPGELKQEWKFIVGFGDATPILSCLDANTGKLVWRKENPENAVPVFFTGMSPLIVDNACIAHVGKKDYGEILALDLNTGSEKWKWAGDGPAYASPSIMTIDGKKHLIVQTEKNLLALNFTDGKLLWQIPTPVQQRFYNCVSPYIDGQTIYLTGQGTGIKAIKVEKSGNDFVTKELWSNNSVGAKCNTPILKDGFLYGFTDQKRIY